MDRTGGSRTVVRLAALVVVGAGAATTGTAVAAPETAAYTVSGVVTRVGGEAVAGVKVVSLDDFGYTNTTTSGADGSYRLTVDYAGVHHVAFTLGDCAVETCLRFQRDVPVAASGGPVALDAPLNQPVQCVSFGKQTGTAAVGSRLTAVPGDFEPAGYALTYDYQWYRYDGTRYSQIDGATGSTYDLTGADRGFRVEVDITGTSVDGWGSSRCGWTNTDDVGSGGSSPSPSPSPDPTPDPAPVPTPVPAPVPAPSAVVPAPIAAVTQVGVTRGPWTSGRVRLGKRLVAHPGVTSSGSVSVAFRWLRGATVVPGATGSTYRLRRADLGRTLTVQVTYSATGHTPTVMLTRPTGIVRR